MKNHLTLFMLCLAVMAEVVTSCSKKDSIDRPPPPVVLPDTLSAGWTKAKCSTTGITDLFFANNNEGYALANGAIFRSSNGGNSWDSVGKLRSQLTSNIFVTPNGKLFVADVSGYICSSVDKGVSFTNYQSTSLRPNDIYFTSDNTGYVVGDNSSLLYTTDAGISWSDMNFAGTSLNGYASLYFIGNTGWIAQTNQIYVVDAAARKRVPSTLPPITGSKSGASVFAVSTSIIYVAFASGEILKSTDGGLNFSKIYTLPASYTDIHFTDEQTGYATNENRIYKTINGGFSWNIVAAVGSGRLIELHFTDATHGWAGGVGIVLKFNG